jgi:putative SOS response-associated peptidase YedK
MCGRYTLSIPAEILAETFGVDAEHTRERAEARYNICPTQEAVVVRRAEDGHRELTALRWGLVPFWAEDPVIGNRMINARAETVADKPAFRTSFKKRRCLVLADGYYEWKKEPGGKQPYWIHRPDGGLLALAGLWSRWEGPAGPLETFAILTTEAHPAIAHVHDRMPVILAPEHWDLWLDPAVEDRARLRPLLTHVGGDGLALRPVSRAVNSPANDSPRLLEPFEKRDPGEKG